MNILFGSLGSRSCTTRSLQSAMSTGYIYAIPLLLILSLTLFRVEAQDSTSSNSCVDSDPKCPSWASQGECQTNAVWMMANCRLSCHSCQGGDRAWKLRTHIASNYDNTTTPNVSRIVRVESVRLNHVEMDEVKQYVRVFGRIVLSWNDSKVTWDRDQWGLSWLNFYWIQIWTPQLIQVNSASITSGSIVSKVLAANYTGQVYMWSDFSFVAPYAFQYEDYPNDYQRICFKFDDKRYFAVRFMVSDEVKNKRREELTETHASGWIVDSLQVEDSKYIVQVLGDWKRDPYDVQSSNCEMCVGLRRNAVYYLTEMLLPALATSALTVSAALFQLSTVQVGLLAFSIVSQILSLILVSSRLPAFAAHTPSILKFDGFNLVASTMLFIFSLILRKMSQSESQIPPPHTVDQFIGLVNRILRIPISNKEAHGTSQGSYAPLAHVLNNLCFAIFLIAYLLAIAFSFIF